MKSLLQFLMEEKQSKQSKPVELPEGFAEIQNRGSLTKEAQEAIGAKSFAKGMEITAAKKAGEVIKKLGKAPQGGTPYEILKAIMKNENDLDLVFQPQVQKFSGAEGGVILTFNPKNDWSKLAGTSSSSKRLVKFWLQSTLYVFQCKNSSSRMYAIDEDKDRFLVY